MKATKKPKKSIRTYRDLWSTIGSLMNTCKKRKAETEQVRLRLRQSESDLQLASFSLMIRSRGFINAVSETNHWKERALFAEDQCTKYRIETAGEKCYLCGSMTDISKLLNGVFACNKCIPF